MFNAIVWRALLVGLIAGLALTGLQQFEVVPLILQAEGYERPAGPADSGASDGAGAVHVDAQGEQAGAEGAGPWAPADGAERTLFTALGNVLGAVGFALVMLALIALSRQGGWSRGLLWGLAGFTVFFVAPTLSGLHPELPGSVAAALDARQAWWWVAVLATAGGLWLMVFGGQLYWRALGLVLLLLPYVLGAPQPGSFVSLVPESMSLSFITATALANGVFWLVLGLLSGGLWKSGDAGELRSG